MPGTVDDFMSRFFGEKTLDDREAAQYHDRFDSTHPDDREFDNCAYHDEATEYLGKLPDDQFYNAARRAFAEAPPQERKGLLGGLMSAFGSASGAAAGSAESPACWGSVRRTRRR